ncbi:MAG: choice-of-anchor I family protein [Emcibacter sp.]|nr:choice-of-anchor I family protein [Emcibacter sp.]
MGQGQAQAADRLELAPLAVYDTGIFNKSAAEIVVYNKTSKLFYVVNGATPSVDVFRLNGKTTERLLALSLAPSEAPTSVATYGKLIAVAVHNPALDGRPGKIILFSNNHKRIADFPAGFLPDMVSFSPDGKYLLVANEGEPDKNSDPEGSLTLIIINSKKPNMSIIKQIDFKGFKANELRKSGVRISPGKSFSQDVEPEYIAFSADSRRAWVSLQENNALAEITLNKAEITRIMPLGLKDHSLPGQGMDPNDNDGINIISVPVMGMYMPDAIAAMNIGGKSYILTANEGDARDEDVKAKKAKFDKNALTKSQIKSLGKLRLSSTDGDTDHDGDIDVPHSYGARSFSIFSDKGKLVFDSGDDFEQITAERLGEFFNSDNKKAASADKRSDNKGPEPEGITVGTVGERTFAFVTLERVGGIMVYDVSDPYAPVFQSYYVSRTFGADMDFDLIDDRKKAGFLGPEGIYFISAKDSPTKKPLLLVANEVSGNVEILEINGL